MRVAAVRITNNTSIPLRLNDNLKLFVGNHQTISIDPAIVTKNIKQRTWLYLLYTLLTLTVGASSTQNSYGQAESSGGTILPIGPFIASANAFMAHMANRSFFKELHEYNLLNKSIEPGQTVYGLVTVHSLTADPIKFEVQ